MGLIQQLGTGETNLHTIATIYIQCSGDVISLWWLLGVKLDSSRLNQVLKTCLEGNLKRPEAYISGMQKSKGPLDGRKEL